MASLPPLLRSRIVGALACQRDSYLRILDTEVISCVKLSPQKAGQPVTETKAKASKKSAKNDVSSASPDLWSIEFTDSVLFPEGGGQPSDYGTLSPLNGPSSDSIPITFVQRQGLRCVCHSPQPLPPGTIVRQEIDFERRWDHMQQHTGQHLLSAIMDTYGDLPTLGWGLGAKNDVSYVDVPKKLSQEEMQSIQDKCNEVIRNNLKITVETPDNANVAKLPDDYDKEKGIVRVVKIGDIDANTCCGTHLSQTSHISLLLLHNTQSVNATKYRLNFTAGERAINFATTAIHSLRSISKMISSGTAPVEVLNNVTKLNETASELKKTEKRLLMDIAKFEGDRVKAVLQTGKNAWVHRPLDGLDLINMIVFEFKDAVTELGLAVLASGQEKTGGHIVIIGEKNSVEGFITTVKEAFPGIKGGGKGGRWQGKVIEWKKGELDALKNLVES